MKMTSTPPAKQRASLFGAPKKDLRLGSLTAIRFFSVLFIVFDHCQQNFVCWQNTLLNYNFAACVSLFFVLSGFVLTLNYPLLEDTRVISRFYWSRLARLYPMHVATLLALIFTLPMLFKVRNPDILLFICNLTMLQSCIPIWKIFFSYNSPSWCNSTLLFLYLGFPLLLAGIRKRWYIPLLVAAATTVLLVVLCSALRLPECAPESASMLGILYVNPLARLFEFCAGMTAAVAYKHWRSRYPLKTGATTALELVIIVLIIYTANSCFLWRTSILSWASTAGSLWLINSGIPAVLFSSFVLVLSSEQGLISKLLRTKFFVQLGELSFSVYMVHAMVLAYMQVKFPQSHSFTAALLYIASVMLTAYLFKSLVEVPGRRYLLKLKENVLPAQPSTSFPN